MMFSAYSARLFASKKLVYQGPEIWNDSESMTDSVHSLAQLYFNNSIYHTQTFASKIQHE